jgi:hypothetical protein
VLRSFCKPRSLLFSLITGRCVLLNAVCSDTGTTITSETAIFLRPCRSDSLSVDYHRDDQSRNCQTKKAAGDEHAFQATVLDPRLNGEWDADADGVAQEPDTGEGIPGDLSAFVSQAIRKSMGGVSPLCNSQWYMSSRHPQCCRGRTQTEHRRWI